LVKHHCHTQAVVREGLEDGLVKLGVEPTVVAKVLNDNRMWAEDPVTVAVRRFESDYICAGCNHIDGLDPSSIPEPGFSLTYVEIAEVREKAGTLDNSGARFIEALREVRYRAGYGFRYKSRLAQAAGHSLALRFWSDGRVEAARQRIEK